MTEREKIIRLAIEAGLDTYLDFEASPMYEKSITAFCHAAIADFLKSPSQYLTNDASREACIKQARNEALEEAAKLCLEEAPTLDGQLCADAIRDMAKEMK